MTKTRELDEVQTQDTNVNRRHYGKDVKFYRLYIYVGCSRLRMSRLEETSGV